MCMALAGPGSSYTGMKKMIGVPKLATLVAILLIAGAGMAEARQATILVDAATGTVIQGDHADVLNRPASLTKMMTLYLAFEALAKGRLSLDEQIPVSARAAGTVPYKLGVAPGGTVSVREAITGMIVLSANDAAIAVGERLGGSEEAFAKMMTAKARQLQMPNTTFRNATGLTADGQLTTARDMAVLGMALMHHFPRQFALFSTRTAQFRGKPLKGHNYMLDLYPGVDGLKTGYTSASGYNVVTSVRQGGRRYVGVVMGYPTDKARDQQMVQLFRQYLGGGASAGAGAGMGAGGAGAGVATGAAGVRSGAVGLY
ncbi:D-alanyl-D-alanine carboxypeptidase family protein [Rhizobium sp. SAFR-030]|uniref:D-alanyl-D-alanine carboxypeptidase family protein n=1 Tax=Rhizobium sp. SAFR-030 TaxID=3387277 RepID=UPI003F7EA671